MLELLNFPAAFHGRGYPARRPMNWNQLELCSIFKNMEPDADSYREKMTSFGFSLVSWFYYLKWPLNEKALNFALKYYILGVSVDVFFKF